MTTETEHASMSEELNAYLDGQLDAAARVSVERHVRGCGVCQEEIRSLRVAKSVFQIQPMLRAPRAFTLSLDSTAGAPLPVGTTAPPSRWQGLLMWGWRLGSLASAACLLMAALASGNSQAVLWTNSRNVAPEAAFNQAPVNKSSETSTATGAGQAAGAAASGSAAGQGAPSSALASRAESRDQVAAPQVAAPAPQVAQARATQPAPPSGQPPMTQPAPAADVAAVSPRQQVPTEPPAPPVPAGVPWAGAGVTLALGSAALFFLNRRVQGG